jgi:hypothetical protein
LKLWVFFVSSNGTSIPGLLEIHRAEHVAFESHPELRCSSMRISCSKIIAFLLLPTLLLAGVGNVFGYAWCISEDGHAKIEYVTANGCDGASSASRDERRSDFAAGYQANGEQCTPCLDFTAGQNIATTSKRSNKVTAVFFRPIATSIVPQKSVDALVINQLLTQSTPRISQTILALRTVVLLT